jgi:DNA primase
MDEFESIVEILNKFLGKPKKVYENATQIQYDCPLCDEGSHKGNLEVNVNKAVYHCWSCGEVNEMHGSISKLIDLFGTKKLKKLYLLIKPEETQQVKSKKTFVKLPEGYTKFEDSNPRYPPHQEALNYLYGRGITDEMIKKYDIGYTMKGNFFSRIVIPSYDKQGALNYFIARSWGKTKQKYLNPKSEKEFIIFNESRINWDEDVYLCEGVFDGLFLPNSIPLLGKHLSDTLFEKLYINCKKNIHICLDGDAYNDALNLYHKLNGGILYGRIFLYKLPKDKDVCDLRGEIKEFNIKIK